MKRRDFICMAAALATLGSKRAGAASREPPILIHQIPSANSNPYIIVPGPDGKAWFTESGANRVASFDPFNAVIQEFELPTEASRPIGMITGGDGNVWFSQNAVNKVGRITPDGSVSEFTCPSPDTGPNGMHRHSDGSIWFAQSNADSIANISFQGHITEYRSGISKGAFPLSIASRGRALWFSEPNGNRLARFEDGQSYELPLASGRQPRAMVSHPDGSIWFVATGAHALGRLDRRNKVVEFPIKDPKASPRSIAVAPDGRIWFTQDVVNRIGVMTPDGRLEGDFPLPSVARGLRGLTALADGRICFCVYDSGHIGELIP